MLDLEQEKANEPNNAEFRENQSYASRLAERITGLRPEDPRMPERLTEDRQFIREKYKLPNEAMLADNPTEYKKQLEKIAKANGVKIKSKSDCGSFFQENPWTQGAAFEHESSIGLDVNQTNLQEYKTSVLIFEHELIHAIQMKKSPDLPIEGMEYEAYVASLNIEFLKENPASDDVEFLFDYYVGGSVKHWYEEKGAENGTPVEPEWNNAEYFLAKDHGINQN